MATLLRLTFFTITILSASQSWGQSAVVRPVEVRPGEPQLLLIEQSGDDVAIVVSDEQGNRRIFDSHIGRTGPELVLLEAAGEYLVEIQGASETFLRLSSETLAPASVELAIARHLTAAASVPRSNNHLSLQEALSHYQQAMGIGDSRLTGLAAFMRAILLYRLAEYGEAIAAVNALDEITYLEDYPYRQLWLKGEIEFSQDLYSRARETLQQALALAQSEAATLDAADIRINLGFSHVLTGNVERGKTLLDEALAAGRQFADNAVIGRAYNNLGGYFSVTGDLDAAAQHLKQAVEYLRESDESQILNYAMSNLSMTYRSLGQYQLAREMSHMALSQAERSANPVQLSAAYTGLASLYLRMGEFAMAGDFARLARDIVITTDREWRSNTLMNMEADALVGEGRHDEAVALYLQTSDYFRRNGPQSRMLSNTFRLGRAYLELGQWQNAEQFLAQAKELLAEYPELSSTNNQATLSELQARHLLAVGESQQAIAILQSLVDRESEAALPRQVEVADLLMQAYAGIGRYELALENGELAVEMITSIREQLEYARLGPAWSKQTFPVFLRLIDTLMMRHAETGQDGLLERAFIIAEQAKAFNLARQRESSLFNKRPVSPRSAELLSEVTRLARLRAARVDAAGNDSLDIEYFRALERYQASLDLDGGSVAQQLGSVSELQDGLSATEALLQFICVPESRCYRFTLTRDSFAVQAVGDYEELQIYSLALQNELRQPGNVTLSTAARMGNALFGDTFSGLIDERIRHLHLVTSYPLNTIPLAVLEFENESLVQRFSLSSMPSASALLADEPAGVDYEFDLAVMADPEFSPGQSSSLIANSLAMAEDTMRGWYGELQRLPWSAREAHNLETAFAGQRVRTMTGLDANKSNLLDSATRNSRIVHIASHGYFSQATPDLVGIATSPVAGDSGFLTLEDLLMHPFNSELVVISGCETGMGQDRGGEGLMSLSRAFLGQGVDHVISTQWPVSDRASAEFMKLFYEALNLESFNVEEALRQAQLQLSSMPQYRSPFYWAPYILSSVGG